MRAQPYSIFFEEFTANGRNIISSSFNNVYLGRHCLCRQIRESAAAGMVHQAWQGLGVTAAVSILIKKRHEYILW